eukprot:scaffold110730_cov59-Attheya_sp.AAC.2
MESMERNISKLVAETAKVSFEDADDKRSDSDSESDKKKKSNCNNSALTRQKKGVNISNHKYAVMCKRQEDKIVRTDEKYMHSKKMGTIKEVIPRQTVSMPIQA